MDTTGENTILKTIIYVLYYIYNDNMCIFLYVPI